MEQILGGDRTGCQGTSINTTPLHYKHISGLVCSPMPASDLLEKLQIKKEKIASFLYVYVILGTVHNFGIFFSQKNLKNWMFPY
jgi:hypothetical protein